MTETATTPPPLLERRYDLNMPQMALGALSEAWLFRELGDLHWTLISQGLRAPSSQMSDANGARLYATFTRLRWSGTEALKAFAENDHVSAQARIKRFGAGVFFGDITLASETKRIDVQLMSSFTKRSSSSSNLSLLKGQPQVPADCPIPLLEELPPFAQQYRQLRAVARDTVLFEHEYRILPYHDINGVGLLYFAAYPTINDLCEMHYFAEDPEWCMHSSTLSRDIHYYGNCNLSDRIIYRLHDVANEGSKVTLISSLTRASDSTVIATLITTKLVIRDAV
jgi:probable biosynthetic protein (TIGR04098 family)